MMEDDPSVRRVFERRSVSEGTRLQYVAAVKDFSDFMGMPPSECVGFLSGLSEEEATEKVVDWIVDAKDRLAPKTCRNWLNGVRVWLRENRVRNIDWEEVRDSFRSYVGKVRTLVNRDAVRKEEIVKILQAAKLRERALICFAASSGLRVGDTVVNLKLKHIKDDLWDESLTCYMVEVPGEVTKENLPHITFISAEAAQYLRAYLKQRELKGEEITPESFLFVTFDGRPIAAATVRNIWGRLCAKAGIDRKKVAIKGKRKFRHSPLLKRGYLYNVRVHSLRKYFKTACSVAGVDRMASEAMMGHSLSSFGIESVYDFCVANLEWLRTQYQLVLPAVTFLSEPPSVKSIVEGEMKRKLEEYETEIRALRELLNVRTARLSEYEAKLAELERERYLRMEYEKRLARVERILEKIIKLREKIRE